MGQRNDNGSHGSPTDLQYIYIYIYNENIFDVVFLEKKNFFYMRVIWVAGRTRTPIIGSLQKSRENPGCRSWFLINNLCRSAGHCWF